MLAKLRSVARSLALHVRLCTRVLRDRRTPWLARVTLGCAVAYFLSPIDLIPDFIPVLGHLDDALIVPALIVLGLALVPKEVVQDHRELLRCGQAGGG